MGLAATVSAAILLLVACSGGSPSPPKTPSPAPIASTTAPAPTVTPLPSATPEPTEEPPATLVPTRAPLAAAPAPASDGASIRMLPGIQFDKSILTVAAGAAITINVVNQDTAVAHNFAVYRDAGAASPVAGAGANVCAGPCSFTLTFAAQAGTYFFRCDVHPADMRGQLIVR
jgi:plastocyanin